MKVIRKYTVSEMSEVAPGLGEFELDIPYVGEILRVVARPADEPPRNAQAPRTAQEAIMYNGLRLWIRVLDGGPGETRLFRCVRKEGIEAEGVHVASFPRFHGSDQFWHLFEVVSKKTRWTVTP